MQLRMKQFQLNNVIGLPKMMGVLLILIFFTSLKTFFLLNINQYLLGGLLVVFLSLSIISYRKNILYFGKVQTTVALLFVMAALLGERGNLNSYLGIFIVVLPFLIFLGFKDVYKLSFLKLLDKVLSITILISLSAWLLFLVGTPLPHYSMEWNFYSFDNYFFFIYIPSVFYAFPRFQFLFIEPGYFGCLMVFMIFLRKYNFREWQTIVYFIALILTYSMSGYLMFFLGLLPFVVANKKNRFKYLSILFVMLSTFLYLTFYNQDNVISQMFAYRMQVEDGQFLGYNRNNDNFDFWWKNNFLKNGGILWGNNDEISILFKEGEKFGVDLRAYVGRFGIIPLIFYFGSLLYYYKRYNSKLGLWFLFLFAIFYYRGYTVMYYIGFSMLYAMGLTHFYYDSKLLQNSKNNRE